MQLSFFERLVLSKIIEGDPEHSALAAQVASATAEKRDYTGVGLYTKLLVAPDAPRLQRSNRRIEEVPKIHLTHPSLTAGAGALLWMSNGLIDCLECYTYEGAWPQDEALFVATR